MQHHFTPRNLVCLSILLASFVRAGDCPVELVLTADADVDSGSYGDVWAEGDIAFVGQFGDNKVHFFDISNPSQPNRYLEWEVDSPNNFASAQDVKSGDGLLFIALEGDGNDGVEILDIRDPFNPRHLTWVSTPNYSDTHNVFYDNGYLYLCDSGTPTVGIVDLTEYDPDNPPARISTNDWFISDIGSSMVHDITVVDGLLYACAWNGGLWIYDVSDLPGQGPVFRGSTSGTSTHAVWPSDNGRWAVAAEERSGGPVKLYELLPVLGGGLNVIHRHTFNVAPSDANSAHNVVLIGNRAYVSWYQAGLVILDIDEQEKILTEVARYDTSISQPFGFSGAWGVYPFLGEDRILVSDMQEGLNIISAGDVLLSLNYPEGLVEQVHPQQGALLTIRIDPSCDQPDPNGVTLFVDVLSEDSGNVTTVSVPFTQIAENMFEAQIPGAPCGSFVSYYVEVQTAGGGTVVDPPDAPQATYLAEVISSMETFFEDDFEVERDWTVSSEDCDSVEENIGAWKRVDPTGTSSAPDNDFTDGEGTMAFVTAPNKAGSGAGQADVDGGPFLLTSPTVEINRRDVVFSFASWFSWNGIGTEDRMLLSVSSDGGESWQVITAISSTGPEWVFREYRLSDFVEPGETLNVRFSVSDCPNDSITEAAIDEFSVQVIECVDEDVTPPVIDHESPAIVAPFSGYIDPRLESTDGVNFDLGIDHVVMHFSEPVRSVGGGELSVDDFTLESTGATPPAIISVDATNNPTVEVQFASPLPPQSWFTLIADVEDMAGNRIMNQGNMGEDVDEPDRIDLAALPGDVDQNGVIEPLDVFRFRQLVNGAIPCLPELCEPPPELTDMNRNGTVNPLDLFVFRQIINGAGTTTQIWGGSGVLDADRP